jgi:hypothetical protein
MPGSTPREELIDERAVALSGNADSRFPAGISKAVRLRCAEAAQQLQGLLELRLHARQIVVLRGKAAGHPVVTAITGVMHGMRGELMSGLEQRLPVAAMPRQIARVPSQKKGAGQAQGRELAGCVPALTLNRVIVRQ